MSVLSLFVSCPKALEDLLSVELAAFGAAGIRESPAGASFSASMETAYRACLWSRIANRVLLPIGSFGAESPEQLRAAVSALPWEEHLGATSTFAVDCTLSGPPESLPASLANANYIALVTKDGIVDRFNAKQGERPNVQNDRPSLRVNVHLYRANATVSIDLSGESLHRRSYRARGVEAPLKENVAAGMLLRARWDELADGGGPLVDPMCGSGTLLVEGAMMAWDVAPGLRREYYGFLGWRGHDEGLWRRLLAEAKERAANGLGRAGNLILGFDRDSRAVAATRANIEAAGLAGKIRVELRELSEIALSPVLPAAPAPSGAAGATGASAGLFATNPPYGERLDAGTDLHGLYQRIGRLLYERFQGWRAIVLAGTPELAKSVGLRATKVNVLYNGPIKCTVAYFEVTPRNRFVEVEPPVVSPPKRTPATARGRGQMGSVLSAPLLAPLGGPKAASETRERRISMRGPLRSPERASIPPRTPGVATDPNIGMFANRILKNRKYIGKWARRSGISCYRLYDADLPEYAVAVDVYEERWLHVQEYVAPGYIDPEKTERRLAAIIGALPEALGVAPNEIFLKKRRRHKRAEQYGKIDESGRFYQVHEAGHVFLVNFTDYLDTGLFLDHRITRALIGEGARGRDFLNLFSYTCTATVFAAKGGASSTTSVDSSGTYLRWGRENLTLNGIAGSEHTLQRADCVEWLRSDRRKYGMIFMDPPTFSNAKDKRPTLDLQRDHVKLIRLAVDRLTSGGVLIFSTNFRRFELDRSALSGLKIEDISEQTIPRDFARNRRIHHCFRITLGTDGTS